MVKVLVLNGAPGSGKDLFVSYCQQLLGADVCHNLSTVDYVKEIAKTLGWDGKKDARSRKFLSDLKDALTQWRDLPFQDVTTKLMLIKKQASKKNSDEIVFIHCREPEEIAKLVSRLGAEAIIIRRDVAENKEQSNHADERVFEYEYDVMIDNNGTVEDLLENARVFLREELGFDI